MLAFTKCFYLSIFLDYQTFSPMPNFLLFFKSFGIDLSFVTNCSKNVTKNTCRDIYDKYWWNKLLNSPKAVTYILIKIKIAFEPFLTLVKNHKLRNFISRFRLSNHQLMIEKGRYARPKIEREQRFCYNCLDKIEDETHFVINCPVYNTEREKLFEICRAKSNMKIHFDSIPTEKQKLIFIMTSDDVDIINGFASYLKHCFRKRDDCLEQ